MVKRIFDDAAFRGGVKLFNHGDYFAAHEAWEELWLSASGDTRHFLQGLIQWAIALYHFQRGNLNGARKLFHSGDALLTPLAPAWQGVCVAALRQDMASFLAEVSHGGEHDPVANTPRHGESLRQKPMIRRAS